MHKPNTQSWLSLIACVAGFQIMGALIGFATRQSVDGWYQTLTRSPLNPPDWSFGVAWTLLYFLLSLAFWKVWQERHRPRGTTILALFAGHMVLNWAWNPLFFIGQHIGAAYALILILIVTAAMLAYLIWPLSRRAALVFAPYIGWLIFAGYLMNYIWRHN